MASIQQQIRASLIRQAAAKRGITPADIDTAARAAIGRTLDQARDSRDLGRIETALRALRPALTITQAAARLGVSEATVRRYLAPSAGRLVRLRTGVDEASVTAYATRREANIARTRWTKTTTIQLIPAAPATTRQVDYIADLLATRVRNGDGGGFVSTAGLLTGAGYQTRINLGAIRALSRTDASQLIDSLKGNY